MVYPQFIPDPLCYVPINPDLKCGEEWTTVAYGSENDDYDDDHRSPITFHMTLPPKKQHRAAGDVAARLNFNCRDKSSGVLLPSEPIAQSKSSEDDEHMGDPFFFHDGYYLEAKTGFQPWPGTRLMVEAFTLHTFERMRHWQTRLASGNLNILEVGAGVGIVGISLAALGGCVLITDLPVLVEHSIRPNLRRNRCIENEDDDNFERHCGVTNHDNFFLQSEERSSNGNGTTQAVVLDWFKPISEQLPRATSSAIEVIIGCDCMWMSKLVEPLLEVVSTIFQHYLSNITSTTTTTRTQPSFFFTYQRRNQSGVFIGLEELLARIKQRGWNVDCVSWRTIYDKEEGNHELYLFEVTPANS